MSADNAYAIVPARGASKRVRGKNTRLFKGVPIILRVLETLRGSALFDEIIVSSDDQEVIELVKKAGYSAPFTRPTHLASDKAGTSEVAKHAIDWLLNYGATKDSHFLLCYPTAVMSTAQHFTEARELLEPGVCDFVFSGARFPSEIQRSWWRGEDSSVTPAMPSHQASRSQDLPPAFYDAGQFYWSTHDGWRDDVLEHGVKRRLYEIDQLEAVDINTEDDWIRAERLFRLLREQSRKD